VRFIALNVYELFNDLPSQVLQVVAKATEGQSTTMFWNRPQSAY